MFHIEELDRLIRNDGGLRRVRLPEATMADFHIADDEQRRRMAFRGMLLGLSFYIGLLSIDWLTVPDVYTLNVMVRLGIGMPIGLTVLWLLSRRTSSPTVHQWGVGLFGYTCVLTTCVVMVQSTNPAANFYLSTSFVVLCFTINLVGMTTRAAAVLCLITTVTTAGFVNASTHGSFNVVMVYLAAGTTVSISCVFANWCLDNQNRLHHLILQRDKIRLRQISEQRDLLEQLAAIDPLTGLANRRGFEAMMASDLAGRSDGSSFAVGVIDIDFFKGFNDTYGHTRGDEALKTVAEVLSDVSQGRARIARMGGEEFALLIVGRDPSELTAIGESVCQAVESRAISHEGSLVASVVTVSVGLASGWIRTKDEFSKLFDVADAALYAAKRTGRNRACIAMA